MSQNVKQLLERVSPIRLQLIAGADGVNNQVSWVQRIETLDATAYLESNELIVISGSDTSNNNYIFKLIQSSHEKEISGVIIIDEPFIKEVPDSIILYCNEKSLPLIKASSVQNLTELIRNLNIVIMQDEQHNTQLADAFKNAINFPDKEELYMVPLSQQNFVKKWPYTAAVFHINDSTGIDIKEDHLNYLAKRLSEFTHNNNYEHCAIFSYKGDILIISGNHTESDLLGFIDESKKYTEQFLHTDECITIGIGRPARDISCLHKSYHQATIIQKLHEKHITDNEQYNYSSMGLYQILLSVDPPFILQDFKGKYLNPLIEYDKANGSDLVPTLKSYLKHSGSVKETADELYAHRNTINYKLLKIEKILKIDLSSLHTRVDLVAALMINDLL